MDTQPTRRTIISPSRRGFILGTGSLLALPLVGCGGGGDSVERPLLAETSSGVLSGEVNGQVISYKGIPYAQAPMGALRFKSPKPVNFTGVRRDAKAFGAASIQTNTTWIYEPPTNQAEDCLSLNVWAPTTGASLPVVVWLHGGGFRSGATSMSLMDGQKLAQMGVVVVTVNYRLGALGHLAHPDFADPDTGATANWAVQDQVAALQWVKANIKAFGGDPNNVTLSGQSGGAMNSIMIAQNPKWRPLVSRLYLVSPPDVSTPFGFSLADAAVYTEVIAQRLGTTPKGLAGVSGLDIHNAELALSRAALPASVTTGRAFRIAPLVDGSNYLSDWIKTPFPANLPVVVTYDLTEGSFFTDLYDNLAKKSSSPPLPATHEALAGQVAGYLGSMGIAADKAPGVIAAYRAAALADGRADVPGDLWTEIFGDSILRNYGVRLANQVAAAGGSARLATYMHPILPPARGVPHCAELPFLFGTYDQPYYKDKFGTSPVEAELSQKWMRSLTSFAANSNSMFSDDTPWPVYAKDHSNTARIGDVGSGVSFGPLPKAAQLAVWDPLLGF
ncbi:carboxylesterase family protein [Ramlibacter sp. WS9]|uniref:carboxylesterase family protein n=1 Tax=Ramlibacter sp. WS9 TaxID=1882741 RepID=UPI00114209C9|nr:carboxylesterase family protein [Ramlibacter sp. WS9]ROZ74429.1 carboxylesterase type B [Ramlibacter sp. WS9]